MQTYHQLFMPVMQLLDGILSTLGNKHATASHQVSFENFCVNLLMVF